MLIKYMKKYNLSREIFIISSIVCTISIILFLVLVTYTYAQYEKKQATNYSFEAQLIDSTLSESIDSLSNYIKFLGQKIVVLPSKNIENISHALINKIPDNLMEEAIFSWTLFDYINRDKMMVFNSVKGILNPPVDMSSREHLLYTEATPWKLFFSPPIIGNPSDEYVIPAGMGIEANDKFYGTLVVGIRLNKIKEKIERILSNKLISFILLDHKSNIITYSADINFPMNKDLLSIKHYANISEKLTTPISIDNIEFAFKHSIESLPYLLILGQNKDIKFNNIVQLILPTALELIFLTLSLIFIMYLLKLRISKPIKMVTDLAKKIANNEHIEIVASRYEEINILAKQLFGIQNIKNKLLGSQLLVKKVNLKIKKINQKLEKKVSARTLELQEALAAKTEFLNNMSHEIRTPIQGFTGISEGLVIHWDEFDDLKKKSLVNEIYASSKRLYSLIGNLLDLSKFQQGKMLLFLTSTDLNILIIGMIEECRTLYLNGKNISFDFVKTDDSKLIADQERISQVLRNLFVNAIKFVPTNSKIEIRISKSQITYDNNNKVDAIHFSISDEGVGIPEAELETVFDPFNQSSRTKTKAGGTGLGLSIVAKIIAAHNGKVWARNNIIKGVTFNFVIPIIYEKQKFEAKIIAENDILLDYEEPSKNLKILMIDDEESCLITMGLLLHNTNYTLIKINSGKEGLNYLQKNSDIDLILLDLMMPDIYGLNLLKNIKNIKSLSHIPVVLQSGSVDEHEITRAFKFGIVAHIKKPYNKKEVISAIKNAT